MVTDSPAAARRQAAQYDFRDFSENLRFGTASDRYAGWIGQIYPEALQAELSSRSRRLGGKSFQEKTLPIHSANQKFF